MDFHNSYCRLCAEIKPSNKQVNLQTDAEKRGEISEKLSRVNARMDFDADSKPRTVCYECISALNKAFDFVLAIEKAQLALNQILLVKNVKTEEAELVADEATKVRIEASEIRIEIDTDLKSEFEEEDNILVHDYSSRKSPSSIEQVKKPKRVNRKPDEDSMPLSHLRKSKPTWASYSWLCTYCELLFPTVEELRTHSMEVHKICNPYQCPDCNIHKILRLNRFMLHIEGHHKHLKYSCYSCFEQFDIPRLAREHKTTHQNSKLMCVGCNSIFLNDDDLKKHIEDYFIKRRAYYPATLMSGMKCAVCSKEFKNKSDLGKHVLIHTERKRDHICEICGKAFLKNDALRYHMNMHNERVFKCEICNSLFKTERVLKSHMTIHDNVKPYICDQCGKCFRLKEQLRSHIVVHSDDLPHGCPHCNKRFRCKQVLKVHIRVHTGFKPYLCSICLRGFSGWPNYNAHMKRMHGLDTAKRKLMASTELDKRRKTFNESDEATSQNEK